MPYDPVGMFGVGQKIGKAKRSTFGMTSDNMFDQFKEDRKNSNSLVGDLEKSIATEGIKSKMRGGQTTGVYSFNPLTGNLEQVETVPKGSIVRNTLGEEDLKKKAMIQQEAQASGKSMEQGAKVGTAAKRLAVLQKQYDDAVKTSTNPLTQRASGPMQVLGAKTGLMPNPKLMALKKLSRPIGIQLIRSFGEVGNLSESEQSSAIDAASQENLTHEERKQVVQQFANFALAGARPEAIDYMMKDPAVSKMAKEYGIQLGDGPQVDIEKEKQTVREKLASGKYDREKLLAIYRRRTGEDYNG